MVPAVDPPSESAPAVTADAAARPTRRSVLGDNPVQTLLTAAAVGLLMFSLTGNRNRIDRLEDTVAAGFAAQDAKIATGFAAQDAKFDELRVELTGLIEAQDVKIDEVESRLTGLIEAQDAKIDETNLKLTALIAALNKAGEVDAAVEGRLLTPANDSVP